MRMANVVSQLALSRNLFSQRYATAPREDENDRSGRDRSEESTASHKQKARTGSN